MLKLLSLFSGIGAFEKALDNLGVPYELVNFCEFDKYATRSYCAIHGVDESKNLGDITKVNEKLLDRDVDVLTYGFPCQDISLSGKQKGMFNEDGSLTRSGLFFEALRIIEHCQPKIAIAENVKNLVGKKFNAQFQVVLASLEAAGYNNYWKVLNAKDFGVPQNRERVFIVSIRKDIDTGKFEFPEGFELKKRLKDVLEDVVDEKYYLSEKAIQGIKNTKQQAVVEPQALRQVRTEYGKEIRKAYESGDTQEKWGNMKQFEPRTDGIANTLSTVQKDNYVAVAMRGRYDENGQLEQQIEVSDRECANAITTVQKDSLVGEPQMARCIGGVGEKKSNGGQQYYQQDRVYSGDIALAHPAQIPGGSYRYMVDEPSLRIRKLTPKECFRLMGFDDESFHKAEAVNSNTQLYKQAGNSIVVDVLEELFCMMLDEDGNLYV